MSSSDQPAAPFAGRLNAIYTGSMLTNMLDLGYRTGLLEAAGQGPATSAELAERAGLNERYVREWLGAMATGGIFTFEPESRRYTLPEDHAAALTGDDAANLAPFSRILNHFVKHLAKLETCFRDGGGVPYEDYWPEFTEFASDVWRRVFDQHLIDGFLGVVPGLGARLEQGLDVLDIGCGDGHAVNVMARAYPASRFAGYDFSDAAIAGARAEAEAMALANARFEKVDVTTLAPEPRFDLITAFDSIHDQFEPETVLAGIRSALRPEGMFLMIDFKFSSDVGHNIGNPFAPLAYGISVMHCMTVSLAGGGPGLGTVWGLETAQRMLAEAGFADVTVIDSPRPQNCIYLCRP